MSKLFLKINIFVLLLIAAASSFFLLKWSRTDVPDIVDKPNKKALMLVSYHLSHNWTNQLVESIRRHSKKLPWDISYDVVAFDTMRVADRGVWRKRFEMELEKLNRNLYDLIVTLDDEATDIVLEQSDRFPQTIPLVFGGYEKSASELKKKHPNTTGVIQQYEIYQNILLGMKLWPELKHAVVLLEDTQYGETLKQLLEKQCREIPELKLTVITDKSTTNPEVLRKIALLPMDFFLVIGPWRVRGRIDSLSLESFCSGIETAIRKPFLSSIFMPVGHGAAGGYLTMPSEHGKEIVRQIAAVMNGGSAKNIPVRDGRQSILIDYPSMERGKLDFNALPSNTMFLRRPNHLWEKHPKELLTLAVLFSVVALSLALCVFYILHYRRLTRNNLAVFARLPVRVGITDLDGNILFFHAGDNANVKTVRNIREIEGIDFEEIMRVFRRSFESKQNLTYEYQHEETKRVMRIAPLPFDMYEKDTLIWISHDNSELQEYRNRLKDANNLWNAVIHSAPFYFAAKDADNRFRYHLCNTKFASDFSGGKASDVIGKTDSELFSAGEAEEFKKSDLKAIKNPDGLEFIERVSVNGYPRVLRSIKKPLTILNGHRLIISIGIDITRETHLLESEEVTNSALKQIALETDFDRNLEQISASIMERLKCDRILLLQANGENSFPLYRSWNRPGVDGTESGEYQFFRNGGLDFLKESNILTISDFEQTEYARQVEHNDIKSLIAGPVFADGAVWEILMVSYLRRKREFSYVDERTIRSMANIISLARERFRQTEEVRRSDFERQTVLNNIRIPIWLNRPDGKTLRTNTAAEAIGEGTFADVTAHDGKPEQKEISFNDHDYIVRAEPVFDGEGKLRNILKTAVDVTEINRYIRNERVMNTCMNTLLTCEDSAMAADIVLRSIADLLHAEHCGIVRFEKEKETAVPLYGLRMSDADKTRPQTPVPFDPEEKWFRELQKNGTCFCEDVREQETLSSVMNIPGGTAPDGPVWISALFVQQKFFGGFFAGFHKKGRELTGPEAKFIKAAGHLMELMLERNQGRTLLLEALEHARAAEKAKSYFLASMSHEIRTPLNAVIGFTELLKDEKLEPEIRKEYLEDIAFSGNALLQLINDVLDLSKLEAGQMPILAEKTDFKKFCREVCSVFEHNAAQKQISVMLKTGDLPEISIDRLRMRQILFNLIGNAVKFTREGGITVNADFVPKTETRGTAIIAITDTGTGIGEEDRKKLFEPFVQLNRMRGTNASVNDTGLGLAITRRLVDRMGGTIKLESTLGKGSTFTVTIPGLEYSEVREETESPEQERSVNAPKMRFLLIDDVPMNLKVLSAMLRKIGAEVSCANSGEEALRLFREESFDRVLTDLWMPGMNGVETARKIREIHPDVRIAVITADVESKNNFDTSVFDDILYKPVSINSLNQLFQTGKGK